MSDEQQPLNPSSSDHIEAHIGDSASDVLVGKGITSVRAGERGVAAGDQIRDSVVITGDNNQVITQRLDPKDAKNQRNHAVMRQLVRRFWIDGVLKSSLYNEVLIRLNLTEQPKAVDNRPWDLILQQPGKPTYEIPPGTPIIDVFDQMNGLLLILGEPGSGKTTMLLELADELLRRAESDLTHPTPVVFNLSSWAEKRQPLAEWLIEELRTKYNISRKVAQQWIAEDELLPLLDGLDEVRQENREDCVKAINQFRQEHLVPLAICSRLAEHDQLTTLLKLQGAVLVRTLTSEQIENYLLGFGDWTEGLRSALAQDTDLQNFVATPLILYLVLVTYDGHAPEDLKVSDSVQASYQRLFSKYVEQVFYLRPLPVNHPYDKEQALAWLINLAYGMKQHGLTRFYIEQLQPSWIMSKELRNRYEWSIKLLIASGGAIIGLLSNLLLRDGSDMWITLPPDFLFEGTWVGLPVWLLRGLVGGWVTWITFRVFEWLDIENIEIQEELEWSRPKEHSLFYYARQWLLYSFGGGLGCGFAFGLYSLIPGFLIGFVLLWIDGSTGLPEWLNFWLFKWLFIALSFMLTGFIMGVILGFIYYLAKGLFSGVQESIHKVEIGETSRPNQGIYASFRNACLYGVVTGLTIGALGFVISFIVFPLEWMAFKELYILLGVSLLDRSIIVFYITAIALLVGFIGGFFIYGGKTIIQHYVLRVMLSRENTLPYPLRDIHLAAYLDDMTQRILLRRVGGGWLFIHKYLLDYFAAQRVNHTAE
ncbi:MAG: NACHT domain-containing protein [Caldilineaceae bacterium]